MKDFRLLNKLRGHYFWLFAPILLAIFIILLCLDIFVKEKIQENSLLYTPFSAENFSKYPIIKNTFNPVISAKGAIVLDVDSRVVLFSKNPDLRFSAASTTKIMTALTALEYFRLNDVLTAQDSSFEGSVIGLYKGQKMTFENLLYGMLLPSGNDAALTIAQNYPGGEKAFVQKMNENAAKWHLYNTHYSDPAGLLDEGDYTTSFDLANLAAISQKNAKFKEVVSTKNKVISDVSGNIYPVNNLNKLLGYDGVDGVKTGYTEDAGQVLVTSKNELFSREFISSASGEKKENHKIIIVVMGSQDRFFDTQKLLSLVSGNISYLSIHP